MLSWMTGFDWWNARTVEQWRLLGHLGKVLMIVLNERLKTHMKEYLADEQAGFRIGRRAEKTTQGMV